MIPGLTILLLALCAAIFPSHAAPAAPLLPQDSDFQSLRAWSKNKEDKSGRRGDPKEKYFHESVFHPHYDGRFSEKTLPEDQQHHHLSTLMQTYLSTMNDIGAETWIVHGSLLGWWWNKKIMPWDSDVDVQVSERSLKILANYYNMTVHRHQVEEESKEKNYLIEVNPHYSNTSKADRLNTIDARWIDCDTGLFIDITALRRDKEAEAQGDIGKMYSKDKHRFREEDIYPLRDSTFEGIPVKIPFAYTDLLRKEYGPGALTKLNHKKHEFDLETYQWLLEGQKAFKQFG